MGEGTIYSRLARMAGRNMVSFHVPGHKNGHMEGMPKLFKEMGRLDLTELAETDNLHSPEGMIKEAQDKASALYGARESFFLVNGTTGGMLAAISAMARPGEKVLLQRDCHRSVFHAVALNNLVPVYIKPRFSKKDGVKLSITAKQVEEALADNPETSLVIATYPSYDGVCSDIEAISGVVHQNGAALLVDSAHGAHLGFSDLFPKSPLKGCADVVVQSTHKTLPAFTQGSMLHINSERVDREALRRMLSVYQSSSPSYMLMAGLDFAREIMEREGRFLLERLHGEIVGFSESLRKNTAIGVRERKAFGGDTGFDLDESKILLDFSKAGISGFMAEETLRKKYGIYVEMAGLQSVLMVSSVANARGDFSRAVSALVSIGKDKSLGRNLFGASEYSYRIPEMAILPGDAFYRNTREVSLAESEGMVCGSYIMPYPPGIPLVCPGERIPGEAIEYLKNLQERRRKAAGIAKCEPERVSVIDENEVGKR